MSNYEALETAIYFLKVPELKALIAEANLTGGSSKQAMINELLAFARGESYDHAQDKPQHTMRELKEMGKQYDPEQYIVPGVYTNSSHYRARFQEMIGSHFSYTVYGMDWIKAQWQSGSCPTFESFAVYWQQEYERRQQTDDFKSPRTLQRVNFFRKMKGQNLSKTALEKAWYDERQRQAELAQRILREVIRMGEQGEQV